MRLDKQIAERFGLSRRQAYEAVRRGHVDVAGRTCFEPGKEVEVETPLSYRPGRPRPETTARRLRVLYEDSFVMIVDKPAGVLTQPTPERERDTLLERAGRHLMRTRGVKRPYVGVVHRIDRDTSGVVLLVCAAKSLRSFQTMFRTHAIERSYIAVVEGAVEPARGHRLSPGLRSWRWSPWDFPPRGRGVRAVTHYERTNQFGGTAAQLACRLETGRTHQIRIHLAESGHPVVGDPVYRPRATPPFPVPFGRQALHAQALGFVHPMTGQNVFVEAPLPDDLAGLIDILNAR